MKENFKNYIISLDYNDRIAEHSFMKSTLERYDEDILTGSTLYVDNYTKKMKWVLTFKDNNNDFKEWLDRWDKKIDNTYQKRIESNLTYFLEKGWNMTSIYTPNDVEVFVTRIPNGIFLYPCK